MAQYKTGSVSVTNGSQIVTGLGTLWSSEVSSGDIFTVVGENAWYEVGSVDSDTQITLSASYAGVSASGAAYAITRDFTTNYGWPYPQKGDIETASLIKRAFEDIDAKLVLTNTDGDVTVAGDITLSAGTANGVAYLNGSKVLTSGSALTFDGTTLATTGALTVSGNTTLGDASTDTVTVNGRIGIGAAGLSHLGMYVSSSAVLGGQAVSVASIRAGGTFGSDVTSDGSAFLAKVNTTAASFTLSGARGLAIEDASKGAGSTITNLHGLYIADQTQGTNNYGITSLVSSGTNKWNIYASGTAANYFAGNVGIGTSSPASLLEVGSAGAGGNPTTRGRLIVNFGGGIELKADAANSGYGSRIASVFDGGSAYNLTFYTRNNSVDWTERFTLKSSEAVFNDTSNDYDFRVESDTNTHALFVDGGNSYVGINNSSPSNPLGVNGSSSTIFAGSAPTASACVSTLANVVGSEAANLQATLQLNVNGGTYNRICSISAVAESASNRRAGLAFCTDDGGSRVEKARLTSDVTSYFRMASGTGGIQFNGDTAAANALDDYEEGTWTPVITGSSSNPTVTYATQQASYVKVGKVVTAAFRLLVSTISGGSGYAKFSLPFTVASGNGWMGAIRFEGASGISTYNLAAGESLGGQAECYIRANTNPTGSGADVQVSNIVANTRIYITLCYEAA